MLSLPADESGDNMAPRTPSRQRGGIPGLSPGRMNFSMTLLEEESHAIRLESQAKEQGDKATSKTYSRHVSRYQDWWNLSEATKISQNPRLVAIPALPITPAKVAMFLQYESTREKKKRGTAATITGSSIGKSQIAQVISALESFRLNFQHEYKSSPEAQISLRTDTRIRQFESAAKHDEPKRAEKAQITKAAGSSSDTYTVEELRKCSRWCLTNFSGPQRVYLGLRDRAMLLVGTATAFRGDSARILLWSDLFKTTIQLGDDQEATVLGALADNAKHNQTGRVDEHGLLRHKHAELCGVGALAFLFFGYFHIAKFPVPDFSPDFQDPEYGVSDTKALGGWNESGSFKNCYDRALPVEALLGAAFFNSKKPELYRVARDCLEPPEDVLNQIFPWIDDELAALLAREHANILARDIALRQFLTSLKWLRRVAVQDAAVLYTENPLASIFDTAPFNSPSFRNFSAASSAAIDAAEEVARLAFQNLPQHLVASLQGAMATQNLGFERERQVYQSQMNAMQSELGELKTLLEIFAGSKSKRVKTMQGSFAGPVEPQMEHLSLADSSFPTSTMISTHSNVSFDPSSNRFPPTSDAWLSAALSEFTAPPISSNSNPTSAPSIPAILPQHAPPGSPEDRKQYYCSRYGTRRFLKHSPEWVDGDWLPHYKYSRANAIWDYWVERKEGVDGYIGVEELTTTWAAKWRRNNTSLKQEGSRRMKVINLILELSAKPRWNVQLTRRFITEKYATLFRARAFADYLTKNRAAVVTAALNYP
ncbi:hypothetical protein C8J57DRAFT_1609308 [Mycena rebaudengoi]|nr:hypothetical protein C8J57DRAFT_1609308 [Mycena rebaudengoi]